MEFRRAVFSFILVCFLFACGGSTDTPDVGDLPGPLVNDNTQPTTPNNPPLTGNSGVLSRIQTETKDALQNAAVALANERYTETKAQTILSIEDTQRLFDDLFFSQTFQAPQVIGSHLFLNLRFPNVYNTSFACSNNDSNRGLFTYIGELDRNANGRMQVNYDNCQSYSTPGVLDGTAYAIIEGKESFSIRGSARYIYFDNLKWTINGEEIFISGYVEQKRIREISSTVDLFELRQFLNFKSTTRNIIIDTTVTNIAVTRTALMSGVFIGDIEGTVYYDDIGQVSVKQVGDVNSGKFTFTSTNQTQIDTSNSAGIKYLENVTGESNFSSGAYFQNITKFVEAETSKDLVVELGKLSIPPSVGVPSFFNLSSSYQDLPIEVRPISVSDDDTPLSELLITYQWFVNDIMIEGVNGTILPVGNFRVGDLVEVGALVSDANNTTESRRQKLTVADRPFELIASSLPESSSVNQQVSFVPLLVDPDGIEPNANFTSLLSGPEGATLDDKGMVTWQTPSKLMFSQQIFTFTFAHPETGQNSQDDSTEFAVNIAVSDGQVDSLLRFPTNSPNIESSMIVGDFTGDGKNQVLTQQNSGISLMSLQNEKFVVDWVYPHILPFEGRAKKILAIDNNNDNVLEIIVVTESMIGLLPDLSQEIIPIKSLARNETLIDVALIDLLNDGQYELVVYYSESGEPQIEVMRLDDDFSLIKRLQVPFYNQMQVVNVNQNNSPGIILNNHQIINTLDWSIQSFFSNNFRHTSVRIGDISGDGFDEVVVDVGNKLEVYSADTQALMYAINLYDSGVPFGCDFDLLNVDNDKQKEIVFFGCNLDDFDFLNLQAFNFKVFKYEGTTLLEYASSDTPVNGFRYYASGDVDNDGQNDIVYAHDYMHNKITASTLSNGQFPNITEQPTYNGKWPSMLGWLKTLENERVAALYSDDFNTVLAQMTDNGVISASSAPLSTTHRTLGAAIGDYNNDLVTDVFVNDTNNFNDRSRVLSFPEGIEQWQQEHIDIVGDSRLGNAKPLVADVNKDGYDDLIVLVKETINVFDIQHNKLLSTATTPELDSNSNYSTTLFMNETDDSIDLIVNSGRSLILFQLQNDTFEFQHYISKSCESIVLINSDEDTSVEVLCANIDGFFPDGQSTLTYFAIENNSFVSQKSESFDFKISAIQADPSRENQQGLLIAFERNTDGNVSTHIGKIDNNNKLIWQGPALKGRLVDNDMFAEMHNGRLELMFSTFSSFATEKYIYWLK